MHCHSRCRHSTRCPGRAEPDSTSCFGRWQRQCRVLYSVTDRGDFVAARSTRSAPCVVCLVGGSVSCERACGLTAHSASTAMHPAGRTAAHRRSHFSSRLVVNRGRVAHNTAVALTLSDLSSGRGAPHLRQGWAIQQRVSAKCGIGNARCNWSSGPKGN